MLRPKGMGNTSWGKSRVSLFFNISCLQHNKTVTIKSHRSIMKSREWWRWYKTLQARTYLPYSTFNTKDAQERHTRSLTTPHAHAHTHISYSPCCQLVHVCTNSKTSKQFLRPVTHMLCKAGLAHDKSEEHTSELK